MSALVWILLVTLDLTALIALGLATLRNEHRGHAGALMQPTRAAAR